MAVHAATIGRTGIPRRPRHAAHDAPPAAAIPRAGPLQSAADMSDSSSDPAAPFRRLERALLRRRLKALDLRLKLELLALGGLIAGFVFWQERIALASTSFAR